MVKRANLGIYMHTLSQVVDTTEQMGDRLNPYFEEVQASLEGDKVLVADKLAEVKTNFHDGLVLYKENAAALASVQAPIPVLGMHKLLVSAYKDFAEGCVEMDASINYDDGQVDKEAFKASEDKQTQAMDKITSQVQRIVRKIM